MIDSGRAFSRRLTYVLLLIVVFLGEASAETDDAALRTARFIDEQIAGVWRRDGVVPAPTSDDAEFLRRVHLDLAGKIPRVSDVRRFLADSDPNKRQREIERLLAGPQFIAHFTNVWRSLLLPEAAGNPQLRLQIAEFEAWLRTQLAEEAGYNQIARRLIVSELETDGMPRFRRTSRRQPNAAAYFLAKEGRPENLAGGVARLFLGLRVECAQCHHHPFAKWKTEQFWGLAAFFSAIESPNPFTVSEGTPVGSIALPGSDRRIKAAYLDGTTPEAPADREALADWIVDPDNPYFAKAAANRLWAHFFGAGLTVPVDDMEPDNPPSHPELLDGLAADFIESGFDIKFLIRVIVSSQTYQRSSRQTHESQDDFRAFARMAVRGLAPEQIYESLVLATGIADESLRPEILDRFADDAEEMGIDAQTTVLQSLTMMNGELVAAAVDPVRGPTLSAVTDFPLFDDRQRIETLYLSAFSRLPTPEEVSDALDYLAECETSDEKNAALSDLFWAMLNSGEFLFNH